MAQRLIACLAVGLIVFIVARRIAGGVSVPPALLPSFALGFALVATLWSLLQIIAAAIVDRKARLAAHMAACALIVSCAAAVTFADSSPWGLLALWMPIALGIGFSFESRGAQGETMAVAAVPMQATIVEAPIAEVAATDDVIALDSALSEMAFADPAVTQQLVRRREADGSETVSGCLRAEFKVGERTVHLHVPFCPPLAGLPNCSAETIDGASAQVKVSQVLRQGARLEVRLDKVATEPQEVVIEFSTA